MGIFRSGDLCSKGGNKDQGDISLWLRWRFPVWSLNCSRNDGIGSVEERVHCGAIISTQEMLTAIVILFCKYISLLVKKNGRMIR